MYSFEKRLRAVKLYFELGNNSALTVRRLGYPDVTSLAHWVDEYQRNQSLHIRKHRTVSIPPKKRNVLSAITWKMGKTCSKQ